jgi:hypothetical protein
MMCVKNSGPAGNSIANPRSPRSGAIRHGKMRAMQAPVSSLSTTGSATLGAARLRAAANHRIAAWLLVCCALVFAMVVLGGVTRLTHSGLSIVEWQPIVGTLPPLSDAAWQDTFAKYQLTPEYQQVNRGMSLAEFKGIFWWEYFHRLLGRLIGVVFLVPLLWFVLHRSVPPGYAWKLFGIFVLGGLQGAMGWYMVKSGLVDDPGSRNSGSRRTWARVGDLRRDVLSGLTSSIRGGQLPGPQRAARSSTRTVLLCVMALTAASSPASAPASPTTRFR